jgi:hypothetical protein
VQWATLSHRAPAAKLEALMPPGFRLTDDVVHVTLGFFRNLYWLAGRGYGLVNVEVPVRYTGRHETVEGGLCLAIWEGRPDAIMTGREELGFPKLFADIPDVPLDPASGRIAGQASWMDFRFFEMEMLGLEPVQATERVLPGARGGPIFFKYMPRTAPYGSGGADVAHATTSAPPPGASGPASSIGFDDADYRRWKAADGSVRWHRASFQQLPTTCHVVNGIADLDILEVFSAEMVEFSVPGAAVATNRHRAIEPA